MLFYFGHRFVVTRTIQRYVDVRCEKCGCLYSYEVRRRIVGEGVAPYGAGEVQARQAAENKADERLARQVATAFEPVPCPKCLWINQSLIEGYRERRYGNIFPLTLLLGVIVLGFSLAIGWFFNNGHPEDAATARFFLIWLPIGIIIVIGLSLVLQIVLMNRFQPNRNYPAAPRLPRGTPPALYFVPSVQVYVRANRTEPSREFEFQFGRHEMPPVCCVCLSKADPASALSETIEDLKITFPLCKACGRQLTARRTVFWFAYFFLSNVVLLVLFVCVRIFDFHEFVIAGFFTIPASLVLASYLISKIRPARVLGCDLSRATIWLEFARPDFAIEIFDAEPPPQLPDHVDVVQNSALLFNVMKASISGERVREVECEKCRHHFFYRLTRKAESSSTISDNNKSQAQTEAVADAQKQLDQELEQGTEPVPCPKCCWINAQAARDYQNRTYGGLGCGAFIIAGSLSLLSFYVGWIFNSGYPADRGPAIWFLTYIPATLLSLATFATISAAILLRSDLNARYPLPPDLPSTIPPALEVNPETGELVDARLLREPGTSD